MLFIVLGILLWKVIFLYDTHEKHRNFDELLFINIFSCKTFVMTFIHERSLIVKNYKNEYEAFQTVVF